MQLATAAADGHPSCRTLVVRGVDDAGRLLACSDARSRKNDQLRGDPRAEACLWIAEANTQFRLTGRVDVLGRDAAAARRVWAEMSPKAKALFTWPASLKPRADDSAFDEAYDGEPPGNYEVLRLVPHRVERLVLSGVPHDRTVWRRAPDGWQELKVNP